MDDFNKILWGFGFSVIGVAFGWTLNQLGQWLRTRHEDKKHLKLVLFNLLETYFILFRSDLENFTTRLSEKIYLRIPKEHQTDESKKQLNSIYLDLITNYFKPNLLAELKTVETNYQTSINTLASIYPLTAYYLNGRNNIIEVFDRIQEWLDNLKQLLPEEETQIDIEGKQVIKTIKPDLLKEALIDLEKDIKNISLKINPFVWFRSAKAIKRLKRNADQKFDKEIEKLLDKLFISPAK